MIHHALEVSIGYLTKASGIFVRKDNQERPRSGYKSGLQLVCGQKVASRHAMRLPRRHRIDSIKM